MEKKIRNLLINFSCFYILFYIFNSSIIDIFIPNAIATSLLCITLFILIFLGSIINLQKKQLLIFWFCIITLCIQLINNHYLLIDKLGNVVKFSVVLFVPFIVLVNKKATTKFVKLINYFCIEHIVATFFAQIFKNVYSSYILPWMANGVHIMAQDNFANGYNPGLTTHYSTNGMYLSISTIYFFSLYMTKKEKKYIFLSILSIIALLFTAKRAHLLFTVFSCLISFLVSSRKKISNKIICLSFVTILCVICVQILSIFVPQILTVVERFEEGISTGNLLNGRQELYDLAIDMWNKNKVFGNGWGSFSYYYHIKLDYVGYGSEYMDAHNVYLQLLCECGILGLLYFIVIAFNVLRKNVILLLKTKVQNNFYIVFSFCFQIFFLLYCLSGNPLYDIQCYFFYFLCIGLTLLFSNEVNMEVLQ